MSEPLYSTVELCVMIDTNYRDFVSALDETPPSTSPYQLNSRILATAMRACNVDIERLRTEATISPIRDASYVSYWIYRSKPISIDAETLYLVASAISSTIRPAEA